MAKKNTGKFWIFVVILTLALWILKDILGMLNKYIPVLSTIYVFCLCVGSAMYLATKL